MSELVNKSKYQSYEITHLLGWALICLGMFTWFFGCYSIFISKMLMPYTGHVILDWIKDDMYYCCVIPCYLICMLIILYFNWAAMKYFRHAQ